MAKLSPGPGLTAYLAMQFLVITALGLLPLLGQEAPVALHASVLWPVPSSPASGRALMAALMPEPSSWADRRCCWGRWPFPPLPYFRGSRSSPC